MSVFKNKAFIVVPIAPANFISVTPGDSSVALSWTSVGTGGDTIGYPNNFYYTVSIYINSIIFRQSYSITNSITAADLANGTSYIFLVKSRNSAGISSGSIQTTATPVSPIIIPTGFAAPTLYKGYSQCYISWAAPTGGSPVTSYQVYRKTTAFTSNPDGGTPLSTPITNLNFIDTNATTGTTYYYAVVARNSAGSVYGTNSVTLGAYTYTSGADTVRFPTNSIALITATTIGCGGNGGGSLGYGGGGGGAVSVVTIKKPASEFIYSVGNTSGGTTTIIYSTYTISVLGGGSGTQGGDSSSNPSGGGNAGTHTNRVSSLPEFSVITQLNGGKGAGGYADYPITGGIGNSGGGGAAGGNSDNSGPSGQSAPTSVPLAGSGGKGGVVDSGGFIRQIATVGSNYGGGGGGAAPGAIFGSTNGAPGCVSVQVYFQV